MSVCYGWFLSNTPSSVTVVKPSPLIMQHMGGFPTIRHNEIRDITASLITEVCPNVAVEPLPTTTVWKNL